VPIPAPEIDDVNRWYWEGLDEGELRYQRCRNCENSWLPPTEECSECLLADWEIRVASGEATLVSWVRFHVAPHPAFSDRIPFNVAVVKLAEGPLTVTNLIDVTDWDVLRANAPLRLTIQVDDGIYLARFALARRRG
jgi:uncharacterized OB-fold protein